MHLLTALCNSSSKNGLLHKAMIIPVSFDLLIFDGVSIYKPEYVSRNY